VSFAFSLSFGGHPCAIQTYLAATMFAAQEASNALTLLGVFRYVDILRSFSQSSDHTKNAFQYRRLAFCSCWKLGSFRRIFEASKLCWPSMM
jgi:hypothetical protein